MAARKSGSGARAAPKKRSKLGAVIGIAAIILVLALGGIAIWLTLETDGFTRSQYIVYNGREIRGSASVEMQPGENVFEIRKAQPFAKGDYTVGITANPAADFYYTTSGGVQAFSQLGDVTDAFDLNQGEDSFTLTLAEGYGLIEFLNAVSGEEVQPVSVPSEDLFIMTVIFADGAESEISFSLPGTVEIPGEIIDGVTVDPPHIVF